MQGRLWVVLAAALAGCVDETTVITDDRAQRACEEAPVLLSPPVGCTTLTVVSTGVWGCGDFVEDGGISESLAGSWVRLQRPASQSVVLRLTLRSPVTCDTDAGPCTTRVLLRRGATTPCACAPRTVVPLYVETTLDVPLTTTDAEVLLQPFGATFDVSLCDAATLGP